MLFKASGTGQGGRRRLDDAHARVADPHRSEQFQQIRGELERLHQPSETWNGHCTVAVTSRQAKRKSLLSIAFSPHFNARPAPTLPGVLIDAERTEDHSQPNEPRPPPATRKRRLGTAATERTLWEVARAKEAGFRGTLEEAVAAADAAYERVEWRGTGRRRRSGHGPP